MKGKIYIIGIGPGDKQNMSLRAINAIKKSNIIIGYKNYINLLGDLIKNKKVISSGMREEISRCQITLKLASSGKNVSLISSGDPGIYGMAGIMLEIAKKSDNKIDIEIIPGITSASTSSAILGSPINNDFAVISLSNLLTPWNIIEKRIKYAAKSDFVICIYNPKSKERDWQIEKVKKILLKYRKKETPVGIVNNAQRNNQHSVITNLKNMLGHKIDMNTTIIIGNSKTFIDNNFMITPRGYTL